MELKPLRAVIYGATGLAGSGVLQECIKHPMIGHVTAITRRSINIEHDKLTEIKIDNFLDYSNILSRIKGHDVCFYCLGVSQIKVPDAKMYREITYDYTMAAAEALIKANTSLTFCFLSGMGTDQSGKSRYMWARVKGETEKDLGKLPIKKLYNFRPGYIHPVGGIKHSLKMGRIIGPLFPILNKLFPNGVTTTEEFGLAMINSAIYGFEKSILENKDIRALANRQ